MNSFIKDSRNYVILITKYNCTQRKWNNQYLTSTNKLLIEYRDFLAGNLKKVTEYFIFLKSIKELQKGIKMSSPTDKVVEYMPKGQQDQQKKMSSVY